MTLALPFNFATYQGATGCTKYGPAGCLALMTYLEDRFPGQASLGICNCRPVSGTGSWSHHAECRAYDNKNPIPSGPVAVFVSLSIVNLLCPHGKALGIDHLITNLKPWESGRGDPRIFSAVSPSGRVYTGVSPHKDHNHIGLTRAAGEKLTYGTLVAVLGPARPEGDDQVLDRNSPKPSVAVAIYQRDLIRIGYDLGDWDSIQPGLYPPGADGRFGDDAENGTKLFQKNMTLPQTGKADAMTVALAADLARFADRGGSGVTEAAVDLKIAAHAKLKSSSAVHPHSHDEGQTGPAI